MFNLLEALIYMVIIMVVLILSMEKGTDGKLWGKAAAHGYGANLEL
jgi:hypothetical protein